MSLSPKGVSDIPTLDIAYWTRFAAIYDGSKGELYETNQLLILFILLIDPGQQAFSLWVREFMLNLAAMLRN